MLVMGIHCLQVKNQHDAHHQQMKQVISYGLACLSQWNQGHLNQQQTIRMLEIGFLFLKWKKLEMKILADSQELEALFPADVPFCEGKDA
ncbi:hypothetical protein OIU79_002437 [Salix purpurea]|uniref:Uncharacterized protein n=1 Tax=Salix purpurea TaxID=77065 RepID=A0A9Q0ZI57_SALPP|nr:hypothetical protein OIU79_002437 [Salix purpurea]